MSGPLHTDPQSTRPGSLSEEQLMAYLEGKLTGQELREVELLLENESMESDALEGLQDYDAAEARAAARQLNLQLQQSLGKKKRRPRRGMMEQRWGWMALVLILLLAIACFAVIHLMKS